MIRGDNYFLKLSERPIWKLTCNTKAIVHFMIQFIYPRQIIWTKSLLWTNQRSANNYYHRWDKLAKSWEDQNWKSTNLQHFGARSTKLLGSARENISRIYKSTQKSDHMFQTLWTQELKIYKSTAFWSMINQTFELSKGEHLKNLQIYREKRPYVPDP